MNIVVTIGLLPALFTEGDGGKPPVTTVLISSPVTTAAPSTTSTTAAPTTTTTAPAPPPTTVAPTRQAATPTTAAPKPKPKPKPKAAPKPAAAKPTTTTTAPPPRPSQAEASTESGRATWYELEGSRPGYCAHKTLPFGTVVTVTNTNTGASIQCTVGDRGPYVDGYIIDLYKTDFEKLQPTSKGWFPARITW